MLTSDFGNYSEITTDSLTSESSEYLSSEIDPQNSNENTKKRTKSRPRTQKKVKYWTLPTMSSGTFNPSMLTARQQLQYLSQKSKLGEESDSLELSPLRLDRIKFEEMKSMSAGGSKEQNETNASQVSPKPRDSSRAQNQQFQDQQTFSPRASSKLKEEMARSPSNKERKVKKSKKAVNLFTVRETKSFAVEKDSISARSPATVITPPITAISPVSVLSSSDSPSSYVQVEKQSSFLGTVKGLIFDYNQHRRNHFENFLKDFAKRLGLSPVDEIVQKKREEITNKGMI